MVLSCHFYNTMLDGVLHDLCSDFTRGCSEGLRRRVLSFLLNTMYWLCIYSMCVCVFSSHSFWTSMDVPAGVTQEEGHTGFLIHLLSALHALIFLARRIQAFLSLVDREVEFWVLPGNDFNRSPPVGHFYFCFLVRKIPFAGIELTSQRVRGLRCTSELPGRPAAYT